MSIDGQLLYRGYKFSEVITLDLYGFPADETSGIEVTTATLPGSDVSLADMLTRIARRRAWRCLPVGSSTWWTSDQSQSRTSCSGAFRSRRSGA